MKLVTLREPHPYGQPGQTFAMDSVNAGGVLFMQDAGIQDYDKTTCPKSDNPKRILVVRPGGFGDILFINPVITLLAKKYPTAQIDYCVADMFKDAILHHPALTNVIQYPPLVEKVFEYDTVFWMENAIEMNDEANDRHITDVFIADLGMNPDDYTSEQKRPRIYLPKAGVKQPDPKTKPRVGFQLRASAKCRTPSDMGPIIVKYLDEGWEVVIFGKPGQVAIDDKKVINLTARKPPVTFLDSAAWVKTCDLIIGPDSSLIHLAAAQGVPAVGMYASFDGDKRVRYSPYTVALQASAPCAPCFWHARGSEFPKPHCKKANRCIVLDEITADQVYEAGKIAINKKRK